MIELNCSCGRTIRLEEKYIGRAAACPGCRRRIRGVASQYQSGVGAFDSALVIQSGPRHVGEQIILGGENPIEVGQADERDIRLRGEGVSRHHCRLTRGGYGWRIEDLDSKNGVFVNGRKVKAKNLNEGDIVRIGSFDLRFVAQVGPAPVVAPTKSPTPAAKQPQEKKESSPDELTLIEDEALMSMTSTATVELDAPPHQEAVDVGDKVTDDDFEGGKKSPTPSRATCPACGAKVAPQARMCVGCGLNFLTGARVAGAEDGPILSAKEAKAKAKAALSGEFGAFISGCVSCATFFTHPGSLVTFLIVVAIEIAAVVAGMFPLGIFTLIPMFIFQGWVCAFLFQVLEHAAAGQTDLPELNLADGIVDSVIAPFVKFFFAGAVCFAPAVAYAIFLGADVTQSIRDGETVPSLLLAMGVFFLPIVMLVVGLGGIGALMRPDLILITVLRSILPYLLVFVLLSVVIIMRLSLEHVLRQQVGKTIGATMAVAVVLQIVQLYTAVVTMQVIGMYYANFKRRFAWSWG